ncbi:uncharacterized protein LOC111404534 [Olea europaea var. sylvestris]|uniref:uncharacterized protein LOC111404534 n=1 Tax=Olea europaea var. sylvestris TaxID=158386 RepID=UPI000C1D6C3E|nr:uncharacterized protein LOC111404534 [Olea europaea var. sylvestris]
MHVIKKNSLAVSVKKIVLCQTKIRFLGYNIQNGSIIPIQRSLDCTEKFSDEILDKSSLQRFLDCSNYVDDFIKEIRLQKSLNPWSHECILAVQKIKKAVKNIPCLSILDPTASIIVETDASDLGFGGAVKADSKRVKSRTVG